MPAKTADGRPTEDPHPKTQTRGGGIADADPRARGLRRFVALDSRRPHDAFPARKHISAQIIHIMT